MRRDLPSGTVTFLFTDVEGSTRLLHELGAERYAQTLEEHRSVLRESFERHGGVEVDTQGDAFFVAFSSAHEAISAAAEAQGRLAVPVRMGIHTGTPRVTEEGYVGEDVHLGARIASAGHGGQVLLSAETGELIEDELTNLGEHRLKDFAEPVPIFQLGEERFPPLKTISNTNLPRPASSFVGREGELEEVTELLQDGARLLTLSGPGGSGKTRLAIEAAAELVGEFKAGVFWVGLAALRDPALVADTIAQTLGAKDGLAEHIGERELLLLLDNLEQVIEAASELASLVETCPNLSLLVTSRERLRVRGEVEYAVPPLAEPEAVKLFCARSGLEESEEIAELCRRLDNLPLAVELAAARTSVLSPAQILERLAKRLDLLKGGRDAEARQQTLRAAIEWSHDLLDAEEQRLFARLAVFQGGCTLEAAEAVVDADLDMLQSLVDKSLLRHSEERFWMLETIREYALERLEESPERTELCDRHGNYFLTLAEAAEPHLRGRPKEWLDRLDVELDNIRGALAWYELQDEERAARLAGSLWRFWYFRGYLNEGRRRLESALAAYAERTGARAKALDGAAVMALNTEDAATARLRAEEALALQRELGDRWGAAYSGFLLGHVSEPSEAQKLYENSIRVFREVGDEHSALLATRNLAWTHQEAGDHKRAKALFEENLSRARATSNARLEASALAHLADYEREERPQTALSLLRQSLRIHRDVGDVLDTTSDLCRFAAIVAAEGDARTAVEIFASLDAIGDELGGRRRMIEELSREPVEAIRSQFGEAWFEAAWDEGRKLTLADALTLAIDRTAADV